MNPFNEDFDWWRRESNDTGKCIRFRHICVHTIVRTNTVTNEMLMLLPTTGGAFPQDIVMGPYLPSGYRASVDGLCRNLPILEDVNLELLA